MCLKGSHLGWWSDILTSQWSFRICFWSMDSNSGIFSLWMQTPHCTSKILSSSLLCCSRL
jgi:hypothetical protein